MDPTKANLLISRIREVILADFARIMESTEGTSGKFILIAVGIEFLGACIDRQSVKATARSEKRFNSAIVKLFPKKYHHFVKKESVPNLYFDYRCPVIHQFSPAKSVALYSRKEAVAGGFLHLTYNPGGSLVLIAEDFYDDLANAGLKLIKQLSPG